MIMIKLKLIFFILTIKKSEWIDTRIKQQAKGLKKYGKRLVDCKKTDYNWRKMALEEVFDCSEYIDML